MAAGRNIKGITIEIGGDTTGLQKALSGVNDKLKNTQAQLKDVNTLLKLDPSNTVLVAQKQELLKNAIADTASKLDTLEAAQKDVTAALEAGKIGQEEYMAFQREVEATKATLSRYQSELDGLNTEQDRLFQLQIGVTRIKNNIICKIQDSLQCSRRQIQDQTHTGRDSLEVPDMRYRCCQFNMSHTLSTNA